MACASRTYVAAHGLPTELAQLRTQPLITANVVGRHLSLRGYRQGQREEIMLAPTLISDHYPFLRQGILAGLGIGLVPDYVVQDVIASGEVLTALNDYRLSIFGTNMYLLYLPNWHQTRAVRTCIDFLMDKARAADA
jgi:DNA-binding transcriptional LysR family regulator